MKNKLHKKSIFLGITIFILFFSIPRMSASSFVNFHSINKKGTTFEWRIETITNTDGNTSWEWIWGNFITLSENDSIILEWSSDPIEDREIEIAGPLNYSGLSVTVGFNRLDFSKDETFFNFFIVPLYVQNKLGRLESGFNALERLWFNTYKLPNAYLPPSYSEYIWNFDMVNGSLENVGENAEKDSIVLGHITSPNFFDTGTSEIYVFDVGYDAKTGIMKWMKYPSVGEYDFLIANSSYGMTEDLIELSIIYEGSKSKIASSFEMIPALLAILTTGTIVLFRRKLSRNGTF